MLAKIAYSTYFIGIITSGLFGLKASFNDFEKKCEYDKKENPKIMESTLSIFCKCYGACGKGFILGSIFGVVWPITLVGETISVINKIDTISKNN